MLFNESDPIILILLVRHATVFFLHVPLLLSNSNDRLACFASLRASFVRYQECFRSIEDIVQDLQLSF